MREFLRTSGGLHTLKPGTRLSYTLFLSFCFANYAVMVALGAGRTGVSRQSILARYVGDEEAMQFGMSHGELLELTHFHLFTMPLLLFVQGHLFMLTAWPARLKTAVLLAAALGIACDLGAPWLVLHVSHELWWVKNLARVLMAPAFALFAAVPLREMWGGAPARSRRARARA